jgi:hypothetical protein
MTVDGEKEMMVNNLQTYESVEQENFLDLKIDT